MEAVLFIGIQASGKSTFYRQHFFNTHVRINLDMLKTRHREKHLFEACLSAKQPFVVDNTNPTIEDRQRYIKPAEVKGFEIVGYYFQSKVTEAIDRNVRRESSQVVPEMGIKGTHARLVLPQYDEGFDKLYYVQIAPGGEFAIEEWDREI